MQTILIVDDDTPFQVACQRQFTRYSEDITVLSAYTLEVGRRLFHETQFIDIILMDGSVESSGSIDTLPLIKEIRDSGYTRPIIATSSDERNKEFMMQHGCDYGCTKSNAVNLVVSLMK